jgi:glycine/D-amino acid oxidase-like deaminating enzyme
MTTWLDRAIGVELSGGEASGEAKGVVTNRGLTSADTVVVALGSFSSLLFEEIRQARAIR